MTWRIKKKAMALTTLLVAALVALAPATAANAYGPEVLYQPSGSCYNDSCTTYVKSAQLPSGKIVASFENGNQTNDANRTFPIFSSTDDGRTWSRTSDVRDISPRGWGNWTNPFFYVLPQQIGSMPAGTLLLAGLNAPNDFSKTAIQIYKSNDEGVTWSWVSEVTNGGGAPDYFDPIWEPNLLVANNKLLVYYSDERNKPQHSQKLVHQASTDGVNWGPVVTDVAASDPNLRPGMPVVTKMADGRYIMTFEVVGLPSLPNNFKISSDPENWGDPSNLGTTIDYGGSPYQIKLPDGRLAYNSYGSGDVRINSGNGSGAWTPVKSNMPNGYSRMLQYVQGTGRVLILSVDGFFSGQRNTVRYGDVDLGNSKGAYYRIVNRNSGQVLDINANNIQDGAQVIQWPNTGAANQLWHVSPAENGYKTLISKSSGRALAIGGSSTANGAAATTWVENNVNDQDWQLVPVGNYYKIVNRNSGQLLSIGSSSTQNGAAAIQWPDVGALDQQWSLVQVTP